MLSKPIQSSWVALNSFYDPGLTYIFSFNSLYSPFWFCAPALLNYSEFLNVTGVYRPLYHCICCFLCHKSSLCFHSLDHVLYILSDLLKCWILMWVCTEFPIMGKVLLLQAAITSMACFDYHWTVFVIGFYFTMKCEILGGMPAVTLISSRMMTASGLLLISIENKRILIEI